MYTYVNCFILLIHLNVHASTHKLFMWKVCMCVLIYMYYMLSYECDTKYTYLCTCTYILVFKKQTF